MVPSRPIRSARQSRSSTASVFACSPGGTSCEAMSRSPSASWAVTPWMPATFASATISTGPGARHELLEQLEGTDPDVDPGGREHDPVGVVGVAVRRLLVDRQPLAIEGVERLLVDRERPSALRSPAATRAPGRPRAAP